MKRASARVDSADQICWHGLDQLVAVPEGKVCTTILELYNHSAIIAVAGRCGSVRLVALLDHIKDQLIRGQNVVCLISLAGNNDVGIACRRSKSVSLIYEGLKHYFTVNFPQRSRALREFPDRNVLWTER